MIKIKKRTISKHIDLKEFMRMKKDGDWTPKQNAAIIAENEKRKAKGLPLLKLRTCFEDTRQDAKAINFGFIFGMSGGTFARNTLETSWTEEACEEYIKENRLEKLKERIITQYSRETPATWKYITCATDIRTKFFNTYPGLMSRIEREKKFAMENGYIRSWHGACRRAPELFFMEKGDNGGVKGDDRALYSRMISNLSNIAANTAIQNLEAVIVMRAITKLHYWFKENHMKSYIWGSVHDSIDFAIHKDELNAVTRKIVEVCAPKILPNEWQGMPQEIDIAVADLTIGEYYKGGKDYRAYLAS